METTLHRTATAPAARMTPARALLLGFASVILAGAGLLTLPLSSASRESAGFLTALFTATSAVCVTGLVVVDPERDTGVRLAHTLISRNVIDEIQLSTDYSILEMAAPQGFVGHSLRDLELRQRYGLSVLAIRRKDRIVVSPNADQAVEDGDLLVVLGQPDKLAPLSE